LVTPPIPFKEISLWFPLNLSDRGFAVSKLGIQICQKHGYLGMPRNLCNFFWGFREENCPVCSVLTEVYTLPWEIIKLKYFTISLDNCASSSEGHISKLNDHTQYFF
jgi:hypothetical protein